MASTLEQTIRDYQGWRTKGNAIWEIYEGQPNPKGAKPEQIAKLATKLGRALPKDFEEFLLLHDGWEGYEYDRTLLSAKQILANDGEEALEINMENMDDDEADKLADVFIIGLDNDTATILYFEKATGELVEHYVEEQGRWPSLTEYFRWLETQLEGAVSAEQKTKAAAVADWEPATRAQKEEAYHSELAARWAEAKKSSPTALPKTIAVDAVPKRPEELTKNGLMTYLGFCGYMLYLPTAAEVTAAALAFRRHFPWKGKITACAPSDEYGRVEIAGDEADYSQFLEIKSGGHFGLRMSNSKRIFNFRGASGSKTAPFLEVLVPANSKPETLRAFVLDLADAIPLAHGLGGYFALPKNGEWRPHMKILYSWCRAHWALEVAHADDIIEVATRGISGVSWLTLVDNATAALVAKHLPALRGHHRRHAMVIEAGKAPTLGDIRVEYPKKIAALRVALAPLLAPKLDEIGYFDDQGGSRAWWRRFEDPAGFAVGPKNLLKTIEAASKARDAKTLRAALGQLTPEAAASLHQELSDLARALLAKDKPTAAVLYEHLTAGAEPHHANLGNSLLSVEKTANSKLADLFIERALPRGKDNPNIFYNVMCVYAERGDSKNALAALEEGAPHFDVRLAKLLDEDKSVVRLKTDPKFTALRGKIRKRLGIESDWAPLARNVDLEKKVGENPNSIAEYRRYAKWLKSVSDPRGELIEAHIDVEKNPRSKPARDTFKRLMTAYLRNRFQAQHPKIGENFKSEDFRWGVLDRMYLSAWDHRERAAGFASLDDPECRFLRTLYLKGMTVDLAALEKKVPYLTELMLQSARFPSLAPIGQLGQLEELSLVGTDVADLKPLRGMNKLRKLYLGGTKVTDLRPIKDLPALEFVSLEGSTVKNIEPLFDLPRLCELWLYKSKVPKAQAEKARAIIDARKIKPGAGVTTMVYGP
jgi:hypothetical protein